MSLIEHQKNLHPTKLISFVRTYIDQIEELLAKGFSVEEVREQLEVERGREINFRSFETCLYRIRKARKGMEQRSSTPLTPAPHEQTDDDDDSASMPEPNTPWKPEKKINPNLLALKERLQKKAEDES